MQSSYVYYVRMYNYFVFTSVHAYVYMFILLLRHNNIQTSSVKLIINNYACTATYVYIRTYIHAQNLITAIQ